MSKTTPLSKEELHPPYMILKMKAHQLGHNMMILNVPKPYSAAHD
jgi:hypothetical protein